MHDVSERTQSGSGLAGQRPGHDVPVPNLPDRYRDDRVVLLAKDPWTLFVYWDFHERTVASTMEGLVDPRVVLRLVALTDHRPVLEREAEIDLLWNGFYLHECVPGRTYRVELVFRGRSGADRLLGRPTHPVTLASKGPSPLIDDRFVRWPDGTTVLAEVMASRLHDKAYALSGARAGGPATSSDRGTVAALGGRSSSDVHAPKGTP